MDETSRNTSYLVVFFFWLPVQYENGLFNVLERGHGADESSLAPTNKLVAATQAHATQTDSEFEEVASQLRPTTSPADISAAADPPADPEDDPKDGRVSLIDGVRPPTAITLRDQIHFERHGVRPERRRRSGRVARSPTGPEPSKGFS